MIVLSIVSTIYLYCLIFNPDIIKEGYQATCHTKKLVLINDKSTESNDELEEEDKIIDEFELIGEELGGEGFKME